MGHHSNHQWRNNYPRAFIMTSTLWWVLLMSLVAAKTSALPAPQDDDYDDEEEDFVQVQFEKFDTNSNGQLTTDEIIGGFNNSVNEMQAKELLAEFDMDKNDGLSPAEFELLIIAGAEHHAEGSADGDEDGVAVRYNRRRGGGRRGGGGNNLLGAIFQGVSGFFGFLG